MNLKRKYYIFLALIFVVLPLFLTGINMLGMEPTYTLRGLNFYLFPLFALVLLGIRLKDKFKDELPSDVEANTFYQVSAFCFFAFFVFKYLVDPMSADQLSYIIFGASALYFIALLIFSIGWFSRSFIKQNFKDIYFTAIIIIIFSALSWKLSSSWTLFSTGVLYLTYFFFLATGFDVALIKPVSLRLVDFKVNIGAACSGITSFALYVALLTLFIVLEWKRINKKRLIPFLIIGAAGIYLVNTFRIIIIMLVGIYYTPELAVGLVHKNLGGVLFILYFFALLKGANRFLYVDK